MLNGGHEFYTVHSSSRIFRRCVLCGHETRGWDVRR